MTLRGFVLRMTIFGRELMWAFKHDVTKMKCPCTKCVRQGKPILLSSIQSHLIKNQRYGMYKVWIGPREGVKFDEEGVAVNKNTSPYVDASYG